MANGHGGARPGAGQKPADLKIVQQSRRTQLVKYVSDEHWLAIVAKAVEDAQKGDYVARQWLTPWLLGAPPKDQDDAIQIKLVE
jgi:hypothetical protein